MAMKLKSMQPKDWFAKSTKEGWRRHVEGNLGSLGGVVGTKIATKALKNGDEVEVDATKGIIRKI